MSIRASVIVPTRGRDQCLRQTLRDLGAQDLEPGALDIWVVDQNDKPMQGLAADVGSTFQLKHERMLPQGSHAGRNHAIFRTEAPLCIFVDDDVRLSPHFVRAHLDAHELYQREFKKVACVAGRVIQPLDGMTEDQMIRGGELARYHRLTGRVTGNFVGFDLGFVDHMHECNFSALTQALIDVGGFNEEFQGNAYFEGTDLALRLQKKGHKIIYRPDIVLTHLQDSAGGNRVDKKSEHTYWFMRNLALLNSIHMNPVGLPFFSTFSTAYIMAKALKNADPVLAYKGLKGLFDGAKYFLPGAKRVKTRTKF